MKLEYLIKTLNICAKHHKKNGNFVKLKLTEEKLESVKSTSLFCDDVKDGYLYLQTK